MWKHCDAVIASLASGSVSASDFTRHRFPSGNIWLWFPAPKHLHLRWQKPFNATVLDRVTYQSRRPIYSLVDDDLIFFFPFFLFSIYMLSLPKNSLAVPRPSVILISLTQNGNTERVAASCWRRSDEDEEGCRGGWRVGTPAPVTDTWRRVSDWFPTRMTRLGALLRPRGARG